MKKKIFITGSGRRIGRALAINFAKKGWDVAIHYNLSENKAIETKQIIENLGIELKCIAVKADVCNYKEFDNAFNQAVDYIGVPDVFINNAGIFPAQQSLSNLSIEEWDSTINTNLRSEFYGAKIFAKVATDGAKIINIGSLGGLEIWKSRLPYNVSKAGVIQLTKALALELAPKIAVNCINPGTIVIPDEKAIDSSEIDVNKIPMKRYGSVEDIFETAYFFANCTNFITGQVINVDGGYHLSL